MSKLSPQQKGLISLTAFRKQMSTFMVMPILEVYFSRKNIKEVQRYFSSEIDFITDVPIYREQIEFIKKSLKFNKIFEHLRIVKYVGISGSLAARKFIEGEDLDLFFVVANDTAWIYRGLLKLFLGKKGRLYETNDIANSLCINFIVEERATYFESDVFTFHELLHLINIYNGKYKQQVLFANKWLKQMYGVEVDSNESPRSKRNILLIPINYFAYILQVFFMKLMRHNPSLQRIKKNFKKGRIAFYPSTFNDSVKKNYKKEYKYLLDFLPTSAATTTNTTSTKTATTTKTTSTSKTTA